MNKGFLEYKTAVFIQSVLERQLSTYRDKLQRPVYFNKEIYIAKDNSIIRIN